MIPRNPPIWLAIAVAAGAACTNVPLRIGDDGGDGSQGAADLRAADLGSPVLFAAFTLTGCARLELLGRGPRCTGVAPLTLRLVPITAGVDIYRWQVTQQVPDAGAHAMPVLDEVQARQRSPQALFSLPGQYQVALAVGGPAGTATALGEVLVEAAPLGATCRLDGQCQEGLRCLCGQATRPVDAGDGPCPGVLQDGLCTRACETRTCPIGGVCMDLSRSRGGAGWQRPVCVPSCAKDAECRPGLLCRELPLWAAMGARRLWGHGCFLEGPGGIGAGCIDGGGAPDPTACATGVCEPLGARDLCTDACDGDCPASAACAAWNGGAPAPAGPRCLPRCDAMHPCRDPLLSCQPGGLPGALGFRLPGEPDATTVCAPRRCAGDGDCKLGRCTALGGASFCVR